MRVLFSAKHSAVVAELKTGDTYNGRLEGVDYFMNVKLSSVVVTRKGGESFAAADWVFLRGNNIKTFRVLSEALEKAQKANSSEKRAKSYNKKSTRS